ncbi:MAG TPA: polymer-forming cytoskeletal protein [Steroidobacteraceae bacterium]|nr:polymer-forming cytoskeletal protein [Steroidobacteraceae bacterium]
MFGRRKQPAAQIETLIAAGTRVEGNLVVTGGVQLEGYVRGNVTCDAGATAALSIAPNGVVEGIVEVPRVVVHGEVRGDIRATDKVELGPTARISGNVTYGSIEMAAGAVIRGRLFAASGPGAVDAEPPPLPPVAGG